MIQKDAILQLKDRLLQNRSEILHLVNDFENGWKDLREPETEFEENAQKEDISQLLDLLEDRERRQIQDIDAALQKMALGTYGYCESCGKSISMKRLDAVPAARLCGKCARGMEVPRGASVDTSEDTLPNEFKGMSDERLAEAIYQYLLEDGRVELDHLQITCRYGAIVLEGTLVTGFSHQLLLEILEDDLGFSRIEDLTHIERPFSNQGEEADDVRDEEELLQGEQVDEDMFESQESGTPVSPPEEIRLP
jgi:RNA polymerase-binding protein DksA